MNQKTKFIIFCILFLILNGCSQDVRQPDIAPDVEFSYVPPDQWVWREAPGIKYKIAVGQPSEGFAPNIFTTDDHAPVALDDYVTSNLQAMTQMNEKMGYKNFKVLNQAEFTTDSNQRGIRVITEREMNDTNLRQAFYFFDGKKDKKFVVTCSVLAKWGESYDKLFDTSMKTFKTTP